MIINKQTPKINKMKKNRHEKVKNVVAMEEDKYLLYYNNMLIPINFNFSIAFLYITLYNH